MHNRNEIWTQNQINDSVKSSIDCLNLKADIRVYSTLLKHLFTTLLTYLDSQDFQHYFRNAGTQPSPDAKRACGG